MMANAGVPGPRPPPYGPPLHGPPPPLPISGPRPPPPPMHPPLLQPGNGSPLPGIYGSPGDIHAHALSALYSDRNLTHHIYSSIKDIQDRSVGNEWVSRYEDGFEYYCRTGMMGPPRDMPYGPNHPPGMLFTALSDHIGHLL